MAAIPTILKGDDSGAITINIASGRTYTGATLVVAYQGVTRSYTNLTPGGTVSLTFTHDETAGFALKTAPMLMRLIGQYGAEETVENADARIKVTDCMAEVNAGGSFVVEPGGTVVDPTKVPITEVGDVAARYTLADLQAKVNQIVRVLAQRSLLALGGVALLAGSAFGALDVQTARLDSLYNDALVVTNVSGSSGVTAGEAGTIATNTVADKVADWALKPNPAPVTDLTPAISYTTSVSNKMEIADANRYTKTEADGRYARYEVSDSKLYFGNEKLTAASIDALDAMGTAVAAQFVNWSGVQSTPTTLSGYGITDAKIQNGTITLGSQTLNPYSHVSGGYDGNLFLISDPTAGWGGFMWMDQTLPTYLTSREGTLSTTILSQARADSGSIATNVIAEANTTYAATNVLVSLNQSVQYVEANGSALTILAPSAVTDGTRDWLVYVNATADSALNLDALGGILVADAAYTNAVKANKVTMLCFSEVTNNVFVIGRQELTPVK